MRLVADRDEAVRITTYMAGILVVLLVEADSDGATKVNKRGNE